MSFDRRAVGRSRIGRAPGASLASSLEPDALEVQTAAADAIRQTKDSTTANPFASSKPLTLTLKRGRNTVPHGLGRKVSQFVVTSGACSLVSSTTTTITVDATAAGTATVVVA